MLRLSAILLTAVCVTLFSCKKHCPYTPEKFNDKVEAINDSLSGMGRVWATKLQSTSENRDFKGLKPLREQMITFIDSSISWLRTVNVPQETDEQKKSGEELVEAEIKFLISERNLIEEVMQPFESFNNMTTEGEMQEAMAKMYYATREEGECQLNLQYAQYNYALKNDFDFNPFVAQSGR